MNIAIIYHDSDFDGKLSNEVCQYWLKKLYPEASIHGYGWDYGRPLPKETAWEWWLGYDVIYIVDLSVDELMIHPEFQRTIVWIDHHKSAIEKWDRKSDASPGPLFVGYRIDGVAACRLCWQYFLHYDVEDPNLSVGLPEKAAFVDRVVKEPELLRLAGEYDIWDHRDPDAKALQFGLRALLDSGLDSLVRGLLCRPDDKYYKYWLEKVIDHGRSIKSYCDKQNDEYALAHATTCVWSGLTWCVLNIGQRGNSDLLRAAIKPEHDALFAWRHDGKQAYVSLYHAPGKEHHDLSVIATQRGGGGHRGACGFRCSLHWLGNIVYGEVE